MLTNTKIKKQCHTARCTVQSMFHNHKHKKCHTDHWKGQTCTPSHKTLLQHKTVPKDDTKKFVSVKLQI